MNRVFAILGGGLALAGGLAYGMYSTYSDLSDDGSTIRCPTFRGKCCAEPTLAPASVDEGAMVAVAGPAGLFASVPVKAEHACCAAKKVVVHSCCSDLLEASEPAPIALCAVAGPAAVARK